MGGYDRPLRGRRGRRRRAEGRAGGELQAVGSLSLVRLLLDNGVLDELTLLTYRVVVKRDGSRGAKAHQLMRLCPCPVHGCGDAPWTG
jgi:hypothetical protein